MNKKKNPFWFYLVLLLIPLIFLVILEVILNLSGYGKNLDQWIETEDNRIALNPDIAARYFTNIENYPSSNNDSFDANKDKNTFRIFVLGGSTTAGFPFSPNGTFARYLKDYLGTHFIELNFEVINLGITAVNTYTLLDLIPGVLEQSPDLIILYAGHNEYYGALGVGSTQNLGSSPNLIYLYLSLNKFKLFQLMKDFTRWIFNLFSERVEMDQQKTLMTGMASEKSIEYESDLYFKGVSQFETNLENILSKISRRNVPVLIGTLSSNVRDQKPFISTNFKGKSADYFFRLGREKFKKGEFKSADSLFNLAKELDGLRFRAPNKFNSVIKHLSEKYNSILVDIASYFKEISKGNIVGNNLMVDHLHPNLEGYRLMARSFYNTIVEKGLLNNFHTVKVNSVNDSTIISNFGYSKLDSLIAQYRINNLLSNWPFKKNIIKKTESKPTDKIAKLAYEVVFENMNWRSAHQEAYRWYLLKKDFQNFSREIKVILSQYPYKYNYYNYAAEKLLENEQYDLAWYFLVNRNRISPDAFSTKWMGNIYLKYNQNNEAIKFLEKSLKLNPNDVQALFNTGLAYYRMGKNEPAKKFFETCLIVNPNHKSAKLLLQKLK